MSEDKKVGKVWMHRVSHCGELSWDLLQKGVLTIGYLDITNGCINIADAIQKNDGMTWATFEKEYEKYYGMNRRRYNLWYFIKDFEIGDIVIVPSYGCFSVCKVVEKCKPITALQDEGVELKEGYYYESGKGIFKQADKSNVDLGFYIKIEFLASYNGSIYIPRKDFLDNKFIKRLKFRGTNYKLFDSQEEINEIIRRVQHNEKINVQDNMRKALSSRMVDVLKTSLTDDKLEKLVEWYLKRIGADSTQIPAKNEGGKSEGADADVIANFEKLRVTVLAQVKQHDGTTNDWAIKQISLYLEQKSDENDCYEGFTPVLWVVSTADDFSDEAKRLADEKGVHLISGQQLADMLLDIGIETINSAFE